MQRGCNRVGFQHGPDAGRYHYRTLELALDFLREPSDWGLWLDGFAKSASAHCGHKATLRSARCGFARGRICTADTGPFVRPGMGLEFVALCRLLWVGFGRIAGGPGRGAPRG